MQRIAVLAGWLSFAFTSTAMASPVKTQELAVPRGGETVAAYLAAPESPGPHPGMVVLHEDWGLNDWVKEQTRRLAEQGYVALAVDLYHGQVTYDPSVAYDLMAGVSPERALQDMEAAFDFLASRPDVDKGKIGSIGWSAGGKWSLMLAVNEPRLAACVVNYGALPTDATEIQRIRAPVLGIFGADDRTIPPSDLDAFVAAMDKAHKTFDLKIYPQAGRGFEDSDNKLGYREGAADDAWQRTINFLDQHLK